MRRFSMLLALLPTLLLSTALVAFLGCEDEGNTEDNSDALDSYFASHPYVSDPRSDSTRALQMKDSIQTATAVGDTLLFEVTGGATPMTWDTTDHSLGTVARQGNQRQAIYTCLVVGDNYVIVRDSKGNTGIGEVKGSSSPMAVSPSSGVLATNVLTTTFEASGGNSPYNWSVLTGLAGASYTLLDGPPSGQSRVCRVSRSSGAVVGTYELQVQDSTPAPNTQIKVITITMY